MSRSRPSRSAASVAAARVAATVADVEFDLSAQDFDPSTILEEQERILNELALDQKGQNESESELNLIPTRTRGPIATPSNSSLPKPLKESDASPSKRDGSTNSKQVIKPVKIPLSSRTMAMSVVDQVKQYGTFSKWVNTVEWNDERNKDEAIFLSRSIDMFMKEGITVHSKALHSLIMRIAGIHSADTFDNWDLCGIIENNTPIPGSLLPRKIVLKTMSQAKQLEGLENIESDVESE